MKGYLLNQFVITRVREVARKYRALAVAVSVRRGQRLACSATPIPDWLFTLQKLGRQLRANFEKIYLWFFSICSAMSMQDNDSIASVALQ